MTTLHARSLATASSGPKEKNVAIDRNDSEERQARLDAMIEEFRAAQQRRLVKAEMARWNRIEAAQRAMTCVTPAPPDKVH